MMRSCRFIVILLLRARVLCRCNGLATIAGKYRQKFVHACGFSLPHAVYRAACTKMQKFVTTKKRHLATSLR